jgi:hypothetical protein
MYAMPWMELASEYWVAVVERPEKFLKLLNHARVN